jgi:hypothetical protein
LYIKIILTVAVNPSDTVLYIVLLMFSLQAEQIAEYDRDSADKQIKYQSKYGTKSCNYVSSSEKVDDIKVPVKTVESNALDENKSDVKTKKTTMSEKVYQVQKFLTFSGLMVLS